MKSLKKNNHSSDSNHKIGMLSIGTSEGFTLINLDSILYLESETSYTTFFLSDNTKIVATKNLGYFEKRLDKDFFIRIHHSTIVNLTKIVRYSKAEGGRIIIVNKKSLPISRTRKASVLNMLKQLC